MTTKNTELCLMYRDADNYKFEVMVVLKGELSQEAWSKLDEIAEDGAFVIAEQLGLPTPHETIEAKGFTFPTEADHAWTTVCELEDEVTDVAELFTDAQPTIDMTAEELAAKIDGVTWNLLAESERLGLM